MSDNETVAETDGSEIQQPVAITTSSYIEQIVVTFDLVQFWAVSKEVPSDDLKCTPFL